MEYQYQPDRLQDVLPKRYDQSFKGTYGKVLVIAGSKNMAGAAYFNAKAAYRTGAGLVYIYTEECNRVILQQLLPEAVLLTYDPENWDEQTLTDAVSGKDVIVIGSGLGTGGTKEAILEQVLSLSLPRILDADALNLLSKNPALWEKAKTPFVVTPHIGEMARLLGISSKEIQADAAKIAQEFSAKRHVITVLKDAKTVTSNGSDCFWNTSGNHGMATGGSGDVLAGIIGGLVAQKMELFEAAKLGVYLHGLAGDAARNERGAYSMIASDIVEHILFGIGSNVPDTQ